MNQGGSAAVYKDLPTQSVDLKKVVFHTRYRQNQGGENLWWDLKDNHGQEIESGFFTYVMGAYFSEDGSLIEVTRGYFIINKSD